MTDPAIEAAQRVMTGPPRTLYVEDLKAAACEALKPIRKLHNCVYGYRLPKTKTSKAELFCKHCQVQWPCETAKLIYTTEELS